MEAVLEIDGKEMCPIKDAVKSVSYSRDYITKLARDGKIRASHVGRNWYVDLDSLKSYEESAAIEQEIRKRKLSEERIRERDLRAEKELHESRVGKKAIKAHRHAAVAAALILFTGTLGGALAAKIINTTGGSVAQVAGSQVVPQTIVESEDSVTVVAGAATTHEYTEGYHSVETKKITPFNNGILILPESGEALSSTTAREVFSDEVLVREAEGGLLEAVRVDAQGREVGEALPMVIVPVNEGGV